MSKPSADIEKAIKAGNDRHAEGSTFSDIYAPSSFDPELFCQHRRETPEEHLERLLDEAQRDIRTGNVSDARAGIEEIRARYAPSGS